MKMCKCYFFYSYFYPGKYNHKPIPFAVYGLSFDVLICTVHELALILGGYMVGMESYYSYITLMQQLEWNKIRAVGRINLKLKGLGDTFKELKKELMKDKIPNKPEKGGYDK